MLHGIEGVKASTEGRHAYAYDTVFGKSREHVFLVAF